MPLVQQPMGEVESRYARNQVPKFKYSDLTSLVSVLAAGQHRLAKGVIGWQPSRLQTLDRSEAYSHIF